MTRKQDTTGVTDVKAVLHADGDYLRATVQAVVPLKSSNDSATRPCIGE